MASIDNCQQLICEKGQGTYVSSLSSSDSSDFRPDEGKSSIDENCGVPKLGRVTTEKGGGFGINVPAKKPRNRPFAPAEPISLAVV